MKKWPADETETLPYNELIAHVKEALLFAYDLERKNEDEDIPYDGWDHTHKATIPGFDELFSAEHLREDKEEQDIDAVDRILQAAFLLGMENGAREDSRRRTPLQETREDKHEFDKIVLNSQIEALEERLCEELGYEDADEMYENEPDLSNRFRRLGG